MGRKIDLTGKRFDKLFVLKEYSARTPQGSIQWECLCDCGNKTIVSGDNLRRNHTKSCGCQKQESAKPRLIDITGQKFGRLTVIKQIKGTRPVKWLCKCDCGNEVEVVGKNLRTEKTFSCGCYNQEQRSNRFIDYTGQKFGKLTVIKIFEHTIGNIKWLCKCDCGGEIILPSHNIGRTLSCGCLRSAGETKVAEILKEANILFEREKSFDDLVYPDTKRKARFDFWVNNSFLIEFDGRQHFSSDNSGWNDKNNLLKVQEHDKIKNDYCKEKKIPLKRIPYTDLNEITLENILNDKYLI